MVLYSASPRRVELLLRLGITPEIYPLDIDETADPAFPPSKAVEIIALRKLTEGLRHNSGSAEDWGLAADTMVEGPAGLLGKPTDPPTAATMIRGLAGVTHLVHTGIAVCTPGETGSRDVRTLVHSTKVRFRNLTESDIQAYVRTGEWVGAAGAYRIQQRGEILIESIEGLWSTVVGLPLSPLYGILSAMNYPFG